MKLTVAEMRVAATAGCNRRIESKVAGMRDSAGMDSKDGWTNDIEGAAAELAYAKWRNEYWGADVNTFKAPDVGLAQVRQTKYRNGKLILRPNDNPDGYYVLVVGEMGSYEIVGWIQGRDGMKDEFWRYEAGRDPAWFVPQNVLKNLRNA